MLQDCVVCTPTIAAPAVPGGASAAGGGALVVSRDLAAPLAETAASLAPLERLVRAVARNLSLEKLHGARRTASALEDVEALVGVLRGRLAKAHSRIFSLSPGAYGPRGSRPYFKPRGWARFAVQVPDPPLPARWPVAYHGTSLENAARILAEGCRRPGHAGEVAHGQHGSATRSSIYLSPSLECSACPVYAPLREIPPPATTTTSTSLEGCHCGGRRSWHSESDDTGGSPGLGAPPQAGSAVPPAAGLRTGPANNGGLRAGSAVRVQGLGRDVELHGRQAMLGDFDALGGRWTARFLKKPGEEGERNRQPGFSKCCVSLPASGAPFKTSK